MFWKDKLNLSYPGYVGNLYKKSYKETVKILYFGKIVKYNYFDTIKLDGNTSIYNIAKPGYSWELQYWKKYKNNLRELRYDAVSQKFYLSPDIIHAINNGHTLLYTILLPFGGNLFRRSYSLRTWILEEDSDD